MQRVYRLGRDEVAVNYLHQHLAELVHQWRAGGYPCDDYPAIAEVMEWSLDPTTSNLRFLRQPQVHALETYWYLRLVLDSPHIVDLYKQIAPKQSQLLGALGIEHSDIKAFVLDEGIDALWERIKHDDNFVRDFKLEPLRETLTLDYPSYILALAMGAGKTILIGAIFATEFAMALEHPDGPFIQNALVFAPGKTIIESLRELADVPYERIIPPRLHKPFSASVKLTFTRDGEKDIPVIRGSSFNVVVTNTEKIRIQKDAIRKSDLGPLFNQEGEDQAKAEVANLRLQAIASLPHLGVFSDEAHHIYGQSLDSELKKVRKTVDYLASATNVYCVVNTTGTPYYKRQALKDVVYWYGLSRGIEDGYLKDIAGNIQAYDFDGDTATYVDHVIRDFFKDYGDVRLTNGAPAKLAVYFPQTNDLRDLRPVIDKALVEVGQSPAIVLVNTSDNSLTKTADIEAFNRLNDPGAPHRVILLVNKGTEGWDCPSLFACALARKLRTSNNFVLQAATRCLRQVPGNTMKARVYLSTENFGVLDRQLQETYGESIADLNRAAQESRRTRITLRKIDLPPLVVSRVVRIVVKREAIMGVDGIALKRPKRNGGGGMERRTYTLVEQHSTSRIMQQIGDTVTIDSAPDAVGAYGVAVDLAVRYRLDLWQVYDELRRLYSGEDIPAHHLDVLARQIEEQTRHYEVKEESVDVALALIKPDGFEKTIADDGTEVYTADIVYPKDRENLLMSWQEMKDRNSGDFGFHYNPYNFDSQPEQSFFEQMLKHLNLHPSEVEDIYFTGAITDPNKTDFFVEYKDDKGKWRRYTPDFIIRKRPGHGRKKGTGRVFIVEIKREHDRAHPVDGENGRKALAIQQWEKLDPDRLRYEMIFTSADAVSSDQLKSMQDFVRESES